MKTRTLLAGVFMGLAAGGAAPASAQTLHYSWVTITGDTTLQPGQSVLLGLQATFTEADAFAWGVFNVRMDGFALGEDSVWVAGARGVDNLSSDGDSIREGIGDSIGRADRFRNEPAQPGVLYSIAGDVLAGDWIGGPAPGSIPVLQFGLPFAEPDPSNPVTFFTLEFFAGDGFGERVLNPQSGGGAVYRRRSGLDVPVTLPFDQITTESITITVVPAPAPLALLAGMGLSISHRRNRKTT